VVEWVREVVLFYCMFCLPVCVGNDKLTALLRSYEYALGTEGGCDPSCQEACYGMLKDALTAKDSYSCPNYEDLSLCMLVRREAWSSLLKECPLLKVAEGEAEAEAPVDEGEAEAEAPAEGEAEAEAPVDEGEAEAEAPVDEGEAEAEVPVEEGEAEAEAPVEEGEAEAEAPVDEGEAEAEAEAPAEGEAEAEAEAPAEGEAEAEAPVEGEAEAEAPAEGEADGECAAASGEAEGESDGLGCWPDFDNYDEFDRFIQGSYYSTVFAAPTNTAGICISVFFWLGLAGTGAWLGRTKRAKKQ
jgi:hypothetical protein